MRACAVKAVASFQISMTIQATNLVGHKQNKGQLHKLDNETGATLILYIVTKHKFGIIAIFIFFETIYFIKYSEIKDKRRSGACESNVWASECVTKY